MKKIIIYGVKHIRIRREIENFLDDNYKIIGYSDGHYERDIWDNKRFIPPENLCHEEFDWVLLNAFLPKNRAEMKTYLQDMGVLPEKIITPVLFLPENEAKTRPDLIADVDANYQEEKRLIFGLSYSLWGINKNMLKAPFYDCSLSSLDLYYNFQLYNYIEQKWDPGFHLQTVLWVFPYYYFDYDASRVTEVYKNGRLFCMWRLDDWHNWKNNPASHDYIENYRMFGRKVSEFYHVPRESYQFINVYGEPKGSATLNRLFFSDHKETEAENRKIFVQFYKQIEARKTKPVLVIPPYYLGALNEPAKRAFYKKREKFYQILKELEPEIGEIKVFDYADRFAGQREFFADVRHLNEAGARELTELINREVL